MAILTESGKAAYQAAMQPQTFHLAWGTGSESWDEGPASEELDATELVAEIGRRQAVEAQFVVQSEGGSIELSSGKYEISETPTRLLMLHFHFDFGDANGETIREVGVFIGTVPEEGVDPGAMYLTPDQVADPGTLLLLEHQTPAILRSSSVRERFRFVVSL